jgi:hypothetical protein
VRPIEGYPAGQGDWVRLGNQLGAVKCYPVGQGSWVRWPDMIGYAEFKSRKYRVRKFARLWAYKAG